MDVSLYGKEKNIFSLDMLRYLVSMQGLGLATKLHGLHTWVPQVWNHTFSALFVLAQRGRDKLFWKPVDDKTKLFLVS